MAVMAMAGLNSAGHCATFSPRGEKEKRRNR
jgi:hypothetical protein